MTVCHTRPTLQFHVAFKITCNVVIQFTKIYQSVRRSFSRRSVSQKIWNSVSRLTHSNLRW